MNKAVEMLSSDCRNLCMFFDILQPLDSHKFAGVKQVLNRNIAHTAKQHPVNPQLLVKAPLATPEHIEIGQEYATVRVRPHSHLSLTGHLFSGHLELLYIYLFHWELFIQCVRCHKQMDAKHFNSALLTGHIEGVITLVVT